ncbi:uncharacterized protein LOC132313844 [Cornus florida]|uniref:uncharacterized protein LOC132313844 n=1 Tax=Cornus florida TaxID=4283 RepID=UPI0028A1A25A|nr:uncharacterized protein LOC132313844 [Cornus florida]
MQKRGLDDLEQNEVAIQAKRVCPTVEREYSTEQFNTETDPNGLAGGLAIFWENETPLTVMKASSFQVTCLVQGGKPDRDWCFTAIYATTKDAIRKEQWNFLRKLQTSVGSKWVLLGDFNDLLYPEVKKGGRVRHGWTLKSFKDFVADCQLHDLGFMGYPFTWCNNRDGDANVKERLDRVLATVDWRIQFSAAVVQHVHVVGSDHAVILLDLFLKKAQRGKVSCLTRGEFRMRNVLPLLKGLGNLKGMLEAQLKGVRENEGDYSTNACDQVQKKINAEWRNEELYWRQKSRKEWLLHGDRNSKKIHIATMRRRNRNMIKGLEDSQGNWLDDDQAIRGEAENYFHNLFTSTGSIDDEAFWNLWEPMVTAEMNQKLMQKATEGEVHQALMEMAPLKAPGPDAVTPIFYQQYWDVIKGDLICFFNDFLEHGQLLKSLNATKVVLIPKVRVPTNIAQFRPISLCNVVMRLFIKILANRLKPLLASIISEEQSVFVPGRLITDNILIAHEVVHFLKTRAGRKNKFMAVKLDMAKAYDRVEWTYLRKVLNKLGFDDKWITVVMETVSTVSYSILLNGSAGDLFVPSRGVRQGNPLSPYLFLLCAEGLTKLINKATADGHFFGIRMNRGPTISHLLFADDSLVFCKANDRELNVLKQLLIRYERLTGQQINYSKSSIIFSANVPVDEREDLSRRLGVVIGGRFDRLAVGVYKSLSSKVMHFWWSGSRSKEGRNLCWLKWEQLCRNKQEGGLGFRDLEAFNIALLAKQGWRLAVENGSLLSRIYKGKYYPHNSFLEARIRGLPLSGCKELLDRWDMREELMDVQLLIDFGTKYGSLRIVPVLEDLKKRQVVESDICLRCGLDSESIEHVMLRCPYAVKSRNRFYYEQKEIGERALIQLAFHHWNEYQEVIKGGHEARISSSSQSDVVRWKAPVENGLKLNFDAAYRDQTKDAATSLVLHDCRGKVLKAVIHFFPNMASTLVAEAMSARLALKWAQAWELIEVEIEGDCSLVINPSKVLVDIEAIWGDIQAYIKLHD